MKEEEISITELARLSGVPERKILDIMAGVREPEFECMCKIAEALGKDLIIGVSIWNLSQ